MTVLLKEIHFLLQQALLYKVNPPAHIYTTFLFHTTFDPVRSFSLSPLFSNLHLCCLPASFGSQAFIVQTSINPIPSAKISRKKKHYRGDSPPKEIPFFFHKFFIHKLKHSRHIYTFIFTMYTIISHTSVQACLQDYFVFVPLSIHVGCLSTFLTR